MDYGLNYYLLFITEASVWHREVSMIIYWISKKLKNAVTNLSKFYMVSSLFKQTGRKLSTAYRWTPYDYCLSIYHTWQAYGQKSS